jgi:tetratricopeptide (TPR) repeat protein
VADEKGKGKSPEEEINQYQDILAKDPTSRVFARLAEAYRKAGQIDYAISVSRDGLQKHPGYTAGQVVLARSLFDGGKSAEARGEIGQVVQAAPDNLMAQKLLAQIEAHLNHHAEAAKAYRMVHLLDPSDEEAQKYLAELGGGVPEEPPSLPAYEPPPIETVSPPVAAPAPEAGAPAEEEGMPPGLTFEEEAAVEEAAVEEIAVEEAAVEEIAMEEIAVEEPAVEEIAVEEIAVEEIAVEEIAVEEIAIEEIAMEEPAVEEIAVEEVAMEEIAMKEPAVEETAVESVPLPEVEAAAPVSTEPVFDLGEMEDSPEPEEPEAAVDDSPFEVFTRAPRYGTPPPAPVQEPAEAFAEIDLPAEGDLGVEPVMQEPPPMTAEAEPPAVPGGDFELFGGEEEKGERPGGEPSAEGVFNTETLANLYITQGFYGKAADVFRQMLGDRPDDLNLRQKLEEVLALEKMQAPSVEEIPVSGGGGGPHEASEGTESPVIAELQSLLAKLKERPR